MHFLSILLCLASFVGSAGFTHGGPAVPEHAVRQFLSYLYLDGRGYPTPIEFEIKETTYSELSDAAFAALERSIEGKPDHPDIGTADYHRRLRQEPQTRHLRVVLGSPSAWLYEERTDQRIARTAGDGQIRWRHSDRGNRQSLAILRSGVRHPALHNLGILYDQAVKEATTLFTGASPFGDWQVVSVSVEDGSNEWRAIAESSGAGVRLVLRGGWLGESPILLEAVEASIESERVFTTRRFENHAPVSDWQYPIPKRVTAILSDGMRIRRTTVVVSIAQPSASSVGADVELPDVDAVEGVTVSDFRSPDSEAWQLYADAPGITWTLDDGINSYDMTEVRAGLRGNPAPITPEGSNSYVRPLAAGLFLVVLTIGGVLVVRKGLAK